MGNLKKSHFPAPGRSGKSPFHIAKELALQQVLRQCRAVNRHERPLPSAAGVVNALGKQFLSRPRLPMNQYIGIRIAEFHGLADDRLHAAVLVKYVGKVVPGRKAVRMHTLAQFALLCLYLFCSLEGEHAAEFLRVTGHRHTIDQHLLSSEPAHLRQDLLFVPDHTVKINIRKEVLYMLSRQRSLSVLHIRMAACIGQGYDSLPVDGNNPLEGVVHDICYLIPFLPLIPGEMGHRYGL